MNSNDLAGGLRQIIRDSSAYYLLGYTSTLNQPDGKFHKINVRRQTPGPAGARASRISRADGHRSRARADAEEGGTAAGRDRSACDAGGDARSSAAIDANLDRYVARHERQDEDQLRLESDTRSPGRASRDAGADFADGRRGQFGSLLSAAAEALAPGRVEFEVPPGPVDLEIAVEDAAGEVIDRETRKIVVPSLGLGLTLSTPEVFRGRTLPEWQKLTTDQAAIPVIERDFRRTDRLLVRVGAQSAAGTPVAHRAYAES